MFNPYITVDIRVYKHKLCAICRSYGPANGIWLVAIKSRTGKSFMGKIIHKQQLLLRAYSISYVLSAALMDLRMADGLWRQNQKIEQEAEVPTCENSEIRLPKPSTEAGFNSVQPLDITVEK